jgi:intein/homing endonuclease
MLKIEHIDETQDVYDLTVNETSCFFANRNSGS